jgi:iron-sulfur cluster repair protein YtfE (RIC family)
LIDDIAFLDDATRPSAPPIEGASDLHRAHGKRLTLFHRYHLQQLAQLRRALQDLEKSNADQRAGHADALAEQVGSMAMIENYRRFGSLCGQECQLLTLHHTIEDQEIFPHLRNTTEGLRKVIDRLSAEHLIVHELLVRLQEATRRFAREPGPVALASLREVYDALERVVISHFGYEERELEEALGFYGIPL